MKYYVQHFYKGEELPITDKEEIIPDEVPMAVRQMFDTGVAIKISIELVGHMIAVWTYTE